MGIGIWYVPDILFIFTYFSLILKHFLGLIFIFKPKISSGIIIHLRKIEITLYTFKTSFAATNVKTGLVRTDVWKKEFAYINIIASGFVLLRHKLSPFNSTSAAKSIILQYYVNKKFYGTNLWTIISIENRTFDTSINITVNQC